MLQDPRPTTNPGDWIGVFSLEEVIFPKLLFRASNHLRPPLVEAVTQVILPDNIPHYTVGRQSKSLIPIPPFQDDAVPHEGVIRRIRVINIEKGERSSLQAFHKYLAPVIELAFDLGQWGWSDGKELHSYIAKRGRLFRKPRT
jgi:hypothetical protein